MVAAENNAARSPRATPEPVNGDDADMSRSQIAQALGSKDPSWFKQTADRGAGSPAYRHEQEDIMSDMMSMNGSVRLPGLSRGSTLESGKEESPVPESVRSTSPSVEGSDRDGSGWSYKNSSNASISSRSGIRSPLPISSAQRFHPPVSEAVSSTDNEPPELGRALAMSPSQGRILPERLERPASPTKGLGGFVQSAMLKRSDSVNKRWSAQAGPGLSRGNSIASNPSGRGGLPANGLTGIAGPPSPPKETWSSSRSREESPLSNSRPGSSYSNTTLTQSMQENEKLELSDSFRDRFGSPTDDGFAKPAIPHHARSRSVVTAGEKDKPVGQPVTTPPTSPSKTMDPRRWSPTKASWLESAINKPDSPKPKAAPPQQPSWMVEINKTKQQRGSVDLGRGATFKEVNTEGLLRSPPLGGTLKSPGLGGLPTSLSSEMVKRVEPQISEPEPIAKTVKQPVETASSSRSPNSSPATPNEISPPSKALSPTIEDKETPKNKRTASTLPPEESRPSPTTKPPAIIPKAKPETPPKKDFRTVLKPRQVSGGEKAEAEPEFKNVFGKLKRTQTKNYVAPDELKNNILRGKAGLTVTAGPKKTERVDELKDSILKKKEEMKAGGPSAMVRKTSDNSITKARTSPTPEAIAKRNALTRSESNMSNGSNGSNSTMLRKTSGSSVTKDRESPTPEAVTKRSAPTSSASNLSNPSNCNDRGSTTPEAITKQKKLREKPRTTPPEKQSHLIKGIRPKEPTGGGKLTDRLNPALAGLISRGPSPLASTSIATKEDAGVPLDRGIAENKGQPSSPKEGQLTHMTKRRARGPKRRLPTTATEAPKRTVSPHISSPQAQQPDPNGELIHSSAQMPSGPTPRDGPVVDLVNNSIDPSRLTLAKEKPCTPPKKPHIAEMVSRSPKSTAFTVPAASRASSAHSLLINTSTPITQTPVIVAEEVQPTEAKKEYTTNPRPLPSPPKSIVPIQTQQRQVSSPMQQQESPPVADEDGPSVSVKSAAALWGKATNSPSNDAHSRSPIKLPTRKDEERAMEDAGLRALPSKGEGPIGLGLGFQSLPIDSLSRKPLYRNLPSPPIQSPGSPPEPHKKPEYTNSREPSANNVTVQPSVKSPKPQTSNASRLFSEFFDQPLTPDAKVDFDAHAILSSKTQDSDKIKTLRKQIWEITGDGKKLPVPSHQEHILFEDSMYLCTHVFGAANGARATETYLWAGDGVSPSSIQDAQLFGRKVAKDHNSKLIILRQGKETANFFQALGGIVITRRGSSSRADGSALYMLCGRRHVGQIAFDEVDMSPHSLCSGFPYIISAKFGKLYLWKGKGSSADELGCARLIGMDLGLTGEIEEVDEGHEPQSFFEAFPAGSAQSSIPHSSDHWRLKPGFDNYRCRLFSIEHEAPPPKSSSSPFWGRRGSAPIEESKITPLTQIREVAPFAQTDLEPRGIFVLDAFFEVYMYVQLPPSRFPTHT